MNLLFTYEVFHTIAFICTNKDAVTGPRNSFLSVKKLSFEIPPMFGSRITRALVRDWYTFIYPFFLYQTVLKKHTKMKKRRFLNRRYQDFTFFLFVFVFKSSLVLVVFFG